MKVFSSKGEGGKKSPKEVPEPKGNIRENLRKGEKYQHVGNLTGKVEKNKRTKHGKGTILSHKRKGNAKTTFKGGAQKKRQQAVRLEPRTGTKVSSSLTIKGRKKRRDGRRSEQKECDGQRTMDRSYLRFTSHHWNGGAWHFTGESPRLRKLSSTLLRGKEGVHQNQTRGGQDGWVGTIRPHIPTRKWE